MKKRIKNIKKTRKKYLMFRKKHLMLLFFYLIIGLFVYKNIMPMGGPPISTAATDTRIRKRIRRGIFYNIGIEDFIKTISSFRRILEVDQIEENQINEEQLDTMPPELILHIASYLPPTNRAMIRCCSRDCRDLVDSEVTDQDLLNHPEDFACLPEIITDAVEAHNNVPVINKKQLIELLAKGRNGLFEKETENIILNAYPNLIDKFTYGMSIMGQAKNPLIKKLARLLYSENINKKRLLFIVNKIFSYGLGLPEFFSAQFILNLDTIIRSLTLLIEPYNEEHFIDTMAEILSTPIKKFSIKIGEIHDLNNSHLRSRNKLYRFICKLDIALKVIFCFEIFHACGTTNFKPLFTGEPFISFKGGKNMAIIAAIKLCIEIIANSHFNSALNIYKY